MGWSSKYPDQILINGQKWVVANFDISTISTKTIWICLSRFVSTKTKKNKQKKTKKTSPLPTGTTSGSSPIFGNEEFPSGACSHSGGPGPWKCHGTQKPLGKRQRQQRRPIQRGSKTTWKITQHNRKQTVNLECQILEMKESQKDTARLCKNISGATNLRRESWISNRSHGSQICNPAILQKNSSVQTLHHPICGFTWMKQPGPLPLDAGFPSWWTGWHPFSLLSTTLGWAQGLLCCEMVPKMKSLTMVRPWISSKSWTSTCVFQILKRCFFFAKNVREISGNSSNIEATMVQILYPHRRSLLHIYATSKVLHFSTCVCCIQ